MTEGRRQMTEGRRQMTESGGLMTEGIGHRKKLVSGFRCPQKEDRKQETGDRIIYTFGVFTAESRTLNL
jgi:hypothetical protein